MRQRHRNTRFNLFSCRCGDSVLSVHLKFKSAIFYFFHTHANKRMSYNDNQLKTEKNVFDLFISEELKRCNSFASFLNINVCAFDYLKPSHDVNICDDFNLQPSIPERIIIQKQVFVFYFFFRCCF